MRNKLGLKVLKYTILTMSIFSAGILTDQAFHHHGASSASTSSGYGDSPSSSAPCPIYTFDDLLDAIEQVESGGNKAAVGANGERGLYQLSEIYIDDVNRICALQGYSTDRTYDYIDAFNEINSKRMVWIYTSYYLDIYASKLTIGIGQSPPLPIEEIVARIHNGGPTGHKKESTKAYWLKVKAELEKRNLLT